MKKILKSKKTTVPRQDDTNTAALIIQIQQQLVSLEKKIDELISKPAERPIERERFPKPFKRFDRSHHSGGGEGRRDDISRERSFTKVICADCQQECEVPFKPSGDRPVYCKECFAKRKEGGQFKREFDSNPRERDSRGERSFDSQERGGSQRHGRRKPGGFRKRRERR